MKPDCRMVLGAWLVLFASALASAIARAPVAVQASASDEAAGAETYHSSGCEYCHGANATGVTDRGPDLSTVGKRLKKDAIAKQIADGGGGMPSFASSLSHDQLHNLVEFLSAQKRAGQ